MVEERAGRGETQRTCERVAPGLGDEDDVRLVEVAPEAGGATFEVTA